MAMYPKEGIEDVWAVVGEVILPSTPIKRAFFTGRLKLNSSESMPSGEQLK